MVKTILGILLTFIALPQLAQAQAFGYVDSEAIIKKFPEYAEAQKELDSKADEWSSEIKAKQKDIDEGWIRYFRIASLLHDDHRKALRDSIMVLEQELDTYKEQTFGYEGELFRLRIELLQPLRTKVFDAIKKVARMKKAYFIFDKNSSLIMVYSTSEYNYTEDVIKYLFPETEESEEDSETQEKKADEDTDNNW